MTFRLGGLPVPTAHLYLFSDACGTDWLQDGHDEDWHTIVNFVFQSSPDLQALVDGGQSHEVILPQDGLYERLLSELQSHLPKRELKKWDSTSHYQRSFPEAFAVAQTACRPLVSACSFQEKTLRSSKAALLSAYNRRIGGVEGRGIGFSEFTDEQGRKAMRHEFLNFQGYHEIKAPENEMLVLLLMSWFVADQYRFFSQDIVASGRYGFDTLAMTVVSDKLSGDNDRRPKSEIRLRNLVDPDGAEAPIVLTRSRTRAKKNDRFSGDFLVDNLAGWLNAAITKPVSAAAQAARSLIPTGCWMGWHQLIPSASKLQSIPAISRLQEVGEG